MMRAKREWMEYLVTSKSTLMSTGRIHKSSGFILAQVG